MALPNGAGGYQLGDGNRNELRIGYAAAAQTATSTATLTAAQITGGLLDGPLAFDNAVSIADFDAEFKHGTSPKEIDFAMISSPLIIGDEWSQYLQLIQSMCRYGWATIEGKMPNITYRLL